MSAFSSVVRRATNAGLAGVAALAMLSTAAGAQAAPVQPPQIVVTARGEVQLTPDRARVQVGVETQARTSAAAANENNRKQAAIIDAIKKLGVPASSISTVNYSVYPVQRYDEKERRTVIDGYRVSNIVQVETDKLEQAGPVIDAGLNNGANRVAALDFFVKDISNARDQALAKAVESAKRQAQAAATAAGGQATELLELVVNEFEQPVPRPVMAMQRMDAAEKVAPTPLSEGLTTVAVSVMTRWKFAAR